METKTVTLTSDEVDWIISTLVNSGMQLGGDENSRKGRAKYRDIATKLIEQTGCTGHGGLRGL